MPSFKTAGKSKEDLAVVVQLAGLLGPDETARMTRAELVKIIEQANNIGENGEKSPSDTENESMSTSGNDQLATEDEPAKKTRTGRTRKTAAGRKKATPKTINEGLEEKADNAKKEVKEEIKAKTESAPTRRRKKPAVTEETAPKPNKIRKTRKESVTAASKKEKDPLTQLTLEENAKSEINEPAKDNQEETPLKPEPKKAAGKASRTRAKSTGTDTRKSISRKKSPVKTPAVNKNEKTAADKTAETKTKTDTISADVTDSNASNGTETVEMSPEAAGAALDKKEAAAVTEKTERKPEAGTVLNVEQSEQKQAETDSGKTKRQYVETGEIQAGVLEIMPDGYGFLRKDNYLQGNKDIYVPPQYIRRFGLRAGDLVSGPVKLQRETDRYQALLYIKEVNDLPPEKMLRRPHFDRLTPIYPETRYILESTRNELSTRIIDLVAPIGKGQRGMIVSPPKAGKTILLQKVANAISINNPESKLIVLLIDERPEEVTDMQRSINGEVVYSTFDKTPENHTKVVELVLERAMRLVELKQDVVILLDSMTRLARAYNLTINPTGRTLSGGLDPGALYGPKRFFGAARNIENGGSLTIIATSLIETGSRMDEVIFEEFKGTGNMEVYLDRKLSEKRIFPAIDINKSGTRREELLLSTKELDAVWTIRKAFSQLDTSSVTEAIINLLLKTQNNEHFIASINVSFNDKNIFEAMRGNRPGTGGNVNQPAKNGSYNSSGYSSNYRRNIGSDDD